MLYNRLPDHIRAGNIPQNYIHNEFESNFKKVRYTCYYMKMKNTSMKTETLPSPINFNIGLPAYFYYNVIIISFQ